ncbi:MAG: cytochrome c [Deltaproteobacteria bacterium]|nr:cytochrome c [Deltaproteobacteria bacterium]
MKTIPWVICCLICIFFPGTVQAQEISGGLRQGQAVYEAHCASCHRITGAGLPNVFPSLQDNAFVAGDPVPLIRLILEGRKARVGYMPAWKNNLTDEQIAAVLTFIRQTWGNQAAEITPEQVARGRKE